MLNCYVICQTFTLRPAIKRVIKTKTPVKKPSFKKPILNRRFLIIGPAPVGWLRELLTVQFLNDHNVSGTELAQAKKTVLKSPNHDLFLLLTDAARDPQRLVNDSWKLTNSVWN